MDLGLAERSNLFGRGRIQRCGFGCNFNGLCLLLDLQLNRQIQHLPCGQFEPRANECAKAALGNRQPISSYCNEVN